MSFSLSKLAQVEEKSKGPGRRSGFRPGGRGRPQPQSSDKPSKPDEPQPQDSGDGGTGLQAGSAPAHQQPPLSTAAQEPASAAADALQDGRGREPGSQPDPAKASLSHASTGATESLVPQTVDHSRDLSLTSVAEFTNQVQQPLEFEAPRASGGVGLSSAQGSVEPVTSQGLPSAQPAAQGAMSRLAALDGDAPGVQKPKRRYAPRGQPQQTNRPNELEPAASALPPPSLSPSPWLELGSSGGLCAGSATAEARLGQDEGPRAPVSQQGAPSGSEHGESTEDEDWDLLAREGRQRGAGAAARRGRAQKRQNDAGRGQPGEEPPKLRKRRGGTGSRGRGRRAPSLEEIPPEQRTIRDIIRAGLAKDRKIEAQKLAEARVSGGTPARGARPQPPQPPALPAQGSDSGAAPGAAPQVQIKDGKIIINQDTLVVEAQQADNPSEYQRVFEDQPLLNSRSYSNWAKPERWSKDDTELFFQALNAFGTDFTMVARLFPTRTRNQIKLKFHAESRRNPARIDAAVHGYSRDTQKLRQLIADLKEQGLAPAAASQGAPKPSAEPAAPQRGSVGETPPRPPAASEAGGAAGPSPSAAGLDGLYDMYLDDDEAYIY